MINIIERIVGFLSDITAIIQGIMVLKGDDAKSRRRKYPVLVVVSIGGIAAVVTGWSIIMEKPQPSQPASSNINMSNYYEFNITFNNYGDNSTDNNGSGKIKRPTYSLQQINEGALGDTITFNSIKVADSDAVWYKEKTNKDLPKGMLRNETNFVGARKDTGINAGSDNVWEGTEIVAEDGETYIVRLYVHNNSPGGMDTVAKDTKVRFYIPYGASEEMIVDGWLTSSNAVPEEYSEIVTFKSKDGTPFSLHYVQGSALLENGGFASGAGIALPDSITNQGNPTGKVEDEWTLIGYDDLDGRVPGCYEYINYVTIKVKAVYGER